MHLALPHKQNPDCQNIPLSEYCSQISEESVRVQLGHRWKALGNIPICREESDAEGTRCINLAVNQSQQQKEDAN